MTAIAAPIRVIADTDSKLTLDDMAAQAQNAQREMQSQSALISQIVVALKDKAAGDGGTAMLQSKTVNPGEEIQMVTPDAGYDGLSSVSIGAVSKTYIGSGVAKKTAAAYTPGVNDQIIAAGQYLNGAQTIKGDNDLIAANIRKDVEIFGVTGTYEAEEPELQEKSVSPTTASQTITPDSGYDGLSRVTVGAMPTAAQATPEISVSSAGLITASAMQSAGYVSAGTKSATKQLTTQAAQTITPGTADKTITAGKYLTGTQTIKGDANLKAANIKSGVSIFSVVGTFAGESGSGGSGPYSAAEIVTWTPAATVSGTTKTTIQHSLGVVPDGFYVTGETVIPTGNYNVFALCTDRKFLGTNNKYYIAVSSWANASGSTSATRTGITQDEFNSIMTEESISLYSGNVNHNFWAGTTYEILIYKR